MLDIQFIRDNAELVQEKSRQKGYPVDIQQLLVIDENRRQLITQLEELRSKRNQQTAVAKGQRPADDQIAAGKQLKNQIADLEKNLEQIEQQYHQLLKSVPNMPLESVPVGESENDNQVAKTVGEKPQFDFPPRSHAAIAEQLGWLDKARAAKVAGSRFAYIKGDLVKLQFAIVQFVLKTLTSEDTLKVIAQNANLDVSTKPFTPVLPPLMIRTELYDAMDRLEPRDDRYKIEDEDLWLQGSAEHVIGSMHADEIIDEAELPLRYIGYATSFRREAGTYGKDMDGMFRMHQFDKLEMESFTLAENGLQEHLLLVAIQEYLMAQLGLPYQLIIKCTADIGKPNAAGVDINAWLPGQQSYRETHTADYMTDYQSRRLKTRVRRQDSRIELVHTNDATALALSRTPIAIIENFQTADGQINFPDVLKPYL